MSSNPPAPSGPSFIQILLAIVGESSDIAALVTAVEAGIAAEKTAVTFTDKLNAIIPALTDAAAVADKLKAKL